MKQFDFYTIKLKIRASTKNAPAKLVVEWTGSQGYGTVVITFGEPASFDAEGKSKDFVKALLTSAVDLLEDEDEYSYSPEEPNVEP